MTEPKFTKGPWGVSDCRTKETKFPPHKGQEWVMEMLEIAAFKKDSDKLVCVARIDHRVNRLPIDKEDIANANLIAAAPDMYEALEEVIKIYNFKEMVRTDKTIHSPRDDPDRGKIFFTYNDLSKARKALRKARGETE